MGDNIALATTLQRARAIRVSRTSYSYSERDCLFPYWQTVTANVVLQLELTMELMKLFISPRRSDDVCSQTRGGWGRRERRVSVNRDHGRRE